MSVDDARSLGTTVPLPVPPAGWFDYDDAVLSDGRPALLRADCDIHAEWVHWRQQGQSEDPPAPRPTLYGQNLRLSKFDGRVETAAIEVPGFDFAMVDCLADGRWLLASTRADPDEKMPFSLPPTVPQTANLPWATVLPTSVALQTEQYGSDGRVLWQYDHGNCLELSICDAYAMTLDGNTLWCCPYDGFPILRIHEGVVTAWRNESDFASALATDGGHALLLGGLTENSGRMALLRLDCDHTEQIGEWRCETPGRKAANLLQGMGATLHIVGKGLWTRLHLAWICHAPKA